MQLPVKAVNRCHYQQNLPWFMGYVTCSKHPLLYCYHCGFVSGRISGTCWPKSSGGSSVLAFPIMLLLRQYQKILFSMEQLVFSSEGHIIGVPKWRGLVRKAGGVNSILRACEEQRCQRSPGEMITLEGSWYWCQICVCVRQTVPSACKPMMM